jgi:hypothetical protein
MKTYTITTARLVVLSFDVEAENEDDAFEKAQIRDREPLFDIQLKPDVWSADIEDYEEIWKAEPA